MAKSIEFGIGFLAGRPNVCKIINNSYKEIIDQAKKLGKDVNFTIFILYDLGYQQAERTEFYGIKAEVYKNIKIKYITPEDIEEEKKILVSRHEISKKDVNLILGHGYARARNSIMYFALKRKIDYLMFWDDDEYPVASIKHDDNSIEWVKQENIYQHLKYIEKSDVTVGYRCGNMSPVPYVEYDETFTETDFKNYIDGVSNEAISWEKIKEKRNNTDNGITYAEEKIVKHGKGIVLENIGTENWLLASGICLNMRHLDKIPAFYNPPFARGEDAFFSTMLKEAKVTQVPTYHFHDGFMKYITILKHNYPKKLKRISLEDGSIEERFLKASIGWIKYKPLLIYITDRKNYTNIIEQTRENLERSIPKMNDVFKTCDFTGLLKELEDYDKNVKKHYKEYIRTNEVWNEFKVKLMNNKREVKNGQQAN